MEITENQWSVCPTPSHFAEQNTENNRGDHKRLFPTEVRFGQCWYLRLENTSGILFLWFMANRLCLSRERKHYVKGFAYCLFSIYVAYCCRRSQKGRKSSGEVTSDLGRLVSGWSQTGGHRFSEGHVCAGLGKREIVEFGKAHWKIRLKLWETRGLWEAEMEKHCVLLCYLYSTLSCLAFVVDVIVSSVNEQTVFLAGQESISTSVCLNSPKKSPPCPALCLLLPPTAQRLQAASVIAMCICNMKHPPPHPCEENK